MHIHDTAVTDRRRDFRQVWDLLTDTHRPADDAPPVVNYWSFCRFEGWMVFSAPDWFDRAGLNRKLHLWKTTEDQLVGLAIVEGNGRDFHVISHPDSREVEPTIVRWVERHWPAEGDTWMTYAEAGDTQREAVLTALGYKAEAASETMHTYHLEHVVLTPELPPGFTFSAASEDGDLLGRARLTSLVFHPERDPIVRRPRPYTRSAATMLRWTWWSGRLRDT